MRTSKISAMFLLSMLLLFASPVHFTPVGDGHLHLHGHLGPEEAEAKGQLYTCSMHPFIIRDAPGNCPICGMTLTPVKADGPGGTTDIRIDPATQQNMGVRTASASRRSLSRAIRTVGIVGYQENHQYSVNSKIDGWIERLHVNETGVFVKKGQPLMAIYSPELVAAQEEFLLALCNQAALAANDIPEIAAGARNLLAASRKRLLYWDISKHQIDELEKSGQVQKTLLFYAPYNGVVTVKKVNEGMFIQAGMELFQISDISQVWVYADIYEYELPWVKVGQKVQVDLPSGQAPLPGRIGMIYPYVEGQTRTVKARIELDNPDLSLKPEMYVNVGIETQTTKEALVIPAEAVLNTGEKQTVFVVLGDGRFEPRPVKLGLQGDDGFVEIKEGLGEHEKVVTSAQFMLDSESTLRAVVQKMLNAEKGGAAKSPTPAAVQNPGQPVAPRDQQGGENLEELFK